MKSDKPTPQPTGKNRNPWSWIPTAYISEGLPNVLVVTVAVMMYTQLGVSKSAIGFWTSLLGFAWTVKPLWGPLVERYWSKRRWVILMQLLMGLSLLVFGFVIQAPFWWFGSLLILAAIALFSATNDIATDGFYMDALDDKQQSFFVGIRSTFYRISMIFGQGVLLIIAGMIGQRTGPPPVEFNVFAGPEGVERVVEMPPSNDDAFVRFEPAAIALNAGESTTVTVALATAPETTRTVNLKRITSSLWYDFFPMGPEQRISLGKGEDVLLFGPDNWQIPQDIVVTVDERQQTDLTVTFQATSGNIALTWAICFAGVGVLLIVFSLYHWLFMPKPLADGAQDPSTTPFWKAMGVMALVVLAPVLSYVALYYSFFEILSEGIARTALLISEGALKFITVGLVLLFVYLIFRIAAVRSYVSSLFEKAASISQVPFTSSFGSFFAKKNIGIMLLFLLVYRLGEGLLVKMAGVFMLDPVIEGGLGLNLAEVGIAYGTVGIIAMTVGGILGGIVVSRHGLKRWMWPMFLAINVPNALYIYLATAQPENFATVLVCVATESFGYGFGFAAYMLYMLYIAGSGEFKTSHFALCTGFMSLGMMIPGMISGDLAEWLGWKNFYILAFFAAVPGALVMFFLPLDGNFGRGRKDLPVDDV